MQTKSPTGEQKWVDPDDVPELTEEFFKRGEIRHGDTLIRPADPPLGLHPDEWLFVKLEPKVVESYRSTGPGWQERINADLRAARKLDKVD